MTIKIEDGVIYRVTGMGSLDCLDAYTADYIAQANGFQYAEQFVKANTGKSYELHWNTYKITKELPDQLRGSGA
jgi:hypothetical protein